MAYPFEIEVFIQRRPDMMDESLEYEMFMGMNQLKSMFKTEQIDASCTTLFLSFPERWLNVIQQRCLFDRCKKFLPNLKKLTIKTHSVYIIQCTRAENVLIVSGKDEQEYVKLNGILPQECDSGVTAFPPTGNLFNVDKLNVVSKDGVIQI